MKVYCDFHIHSCLSPCGDDDNTPSNIAGMAYIKGLNAIAVADHNSNKNIAAVVEAARKYGITVLPAMEVTTSEDIHILTLFANSNDCDEFYSVLDGRRVVVQNDKKVFGNQYIMSSSDEIIGEEDRLLIVGIDMTIDEVRDTVFGLGGIAVPAHIDKPSSSVTAVLGGFYEDMGFNVVELSRNVTDDFILSCEALSSCLILRNSDAHYLADISEAENYLEIADSNPDTIINYLRKRQKTFA